MLKIGERKGAGLSDGHANKRQASDRLLFGAIRDEMTARNTATIATADSAVTAIDDADAPSAGYVQAEAVSTADLANDLKAKYNAMVTLVNELKASLNTASATANLFEK